MRGMAQHKVVLCGRGGGGVNWTLSATCGGGIECADCPEPARLIFISPDWSGLLELCERCAGERANAARALAR